MRQTLVEGSTKPSLESTPSDRELVAGSTKSESKPGQTSLSGHHQEMLLHVEVELIAKLLLEMGVGGGGASSTKTRSTTAGSP